MPTSIPPRRVSCRRDPAANVPHRPRSVVFDASRGEQRLGAVWIQRQPGRTASFEPVQIDRTLVEARDAANRIAESLISEAIKFAVAGGAPRMMQTLLDTDTGVDADRLRAAGFQHAAELLYMVSELVNFPTAAPASALEFEPVTIGAPNATPSPSTGEGRGEG